MEYTPGPQPDNPGVPTASWLNPEVYGKLHKPWPRVVQSIMALASDPGTARIRAGQPVVNRVATFPDNNLFIGGFIGKTKG